MRYILIGTSAPSIGPLTVEDIENIIDKTNTKFFVPAGKKSADQENKTVS